MHCRTSNGYYYRFEPNATSNLKIQHSKDDSDSIFATKTLSFTTTSSTVTPTLPSGFDEAHVILDIGNYYRFRSSISHSIQKTGDDGKFGSCSFTAA